MTLALKLRLKVMRKNSRLCRANHFYQNKEDHHTLITIGHFLGRGKVERHTKGKEKYIFPFQDESDVTINSAAIYEIGVLKTYVEPLLYSVESTSPYYEEAKRLINFLRLFLPIPADAIPQDAVIREFIGGSYFHE